MDNKLLRDIIFDYEQIAAIINKRLNELRSLAGIHGTTDPVITSKVHQMNIKKEIDTQRQEILSRVDSIRSSANQKMNTTRVEPSQGMFAKGSFPMMHPSTMQTPVQKQIEKKKDDVEND